jgi:hypothetical protein
MVGWIRFKAPNLPLTTCPMPGTSKTGFGQVKIIKEFVWINIICFLDLAFGQVQVGETN